MTALSPQEIRADFERVNALIERQLRLLEANGGDTLALARDADVARWSTSSLSPPRPRAAMSTSS